ncbi:RHS repeat-associated core domain-containing protein, partial [bacterium]|nr:RHS repeat-associated core domain-containing protein [bacterium]
FSVYGLTDGEGALVEAYEYDPYGAHFLLTDGDDGDSVVNFSTNDARTSMGISREEGEEIANPYTFTGRRFDPETGWHYYRERYYDSERGRFVSRDYGVRLSVSSYSGALDAISAGNGDAFQGKMPGEARYDDGPNLYAYAKDSPCRYRDPMGRMSREAWNCACKASGKAEKELDRLREAAKQIDGFSYGSLNPFKEEMGCGWCAANLLSFLAVVKEHPPVCWDFNWFSGRKWLIPGGGVLPIPNMVLKHHFIALKPTIDEVSYTDPENEGRPVFDGWGGLWGNITWRCRFSEGTVGAYYREWGSAGLTWSVEPQY